LGAMTARVGIEAIGVYPCSLALDMPSLCERRCHDAADIRDSMMVDERSLNPLWEDPVTMAVNAARLILKDEDRAKIELLVVASESGVDQEKPMSTWVHRYLDLTPNCRNYEVKHACYGGTAALQTAASWIASGLAGDAKALIVTTDQSRIHLGKPWEYVLGAGAAAVLVSANPRMVEFELGKSGYWTHEVSDLTRPTLTVETGNSETSLLAYIDALEGAYAHYCERVKMTDGFDRYFKKHIYHAPFGGMTWRAHRTLLRQASPLSKDQAWDHFQRKSGAALRYLRRMGGTYSSSTFVGLTSLLATSDDLQPGDRISIFSYGSGSCAEFYSVRVGTDAARTAAAADVDGLLDARRRVTPDEYEMLETKRTALVENGDYETIDGALDDWYGRHYRGRGLLVFQGMKDYYRQYAWS
jgi:3-hydroxy-3-methylglutaryl CoA synthase